MPTFKSRERQPAMRNLHAAIEHYVIFLEQEKQLLPSTVFHYGHDLQLFKRFVERKYKGKANKLPASVVSAQTVASFLRHQSAYRRNSPSSNNRRKASLRGFVTFLERAKIIEPQGDLELDMPKQVKRLPSVLSPHEINGILDAARTAAPNPPRDTAMFLVFLTCGLHLSELLHLNTTDIDPDNKRIFIAPSKDTFRVLPLTPETDMALKTYLSHRPRVTTQRLFLNRSKQPLTKGGVYHAFSRCLAAAGIRRLDISVGTLRNTFILNLLESKQHSRRRVLELSGLRSTSALSPYVHLKLTRRR